MPSKRLVFKNVSLEPFDQLANAVIVEDGWILAVGDWFQLQGLVDRKTRIIDGRGCTLLPGIEDSHLHGYLVGRRLSGVDVSPESCRDLAEVNKAVSHYASVRSGWIRGYGWESGTLKGSGPGSTPHFRDLRASGVLRPVVLTDFSGHQAWCNEAALDAAGINLGTQDPAGGVIVRDPAGKPTGLLLEAAVKLVTSAMPPPRAAEIREALVTARKIAHEAGITAFTEPGLGPGASSLDDGSASLDVLDAYRALDSEGELKLRVNVMLLFGGLGGTSESDVLEGLDAYGPPEPARRGSMLVVDQLKLFADGIPRSRTAWMSEPYDNCERGSLTVAGDTDSERVQTLNAIVNQATARGWQLGIHATGDETISSILSCFESVPDSAAGRHYVIHGDIMKASDLPRFVETGVGLNVQPGIRWLVGNKVDHILGTKRASSRIPLKSIFQAGVALSLSSDAPVTEVDWKHIYASATNRNFKDDPGADDGQALTPVEAMRCLTLSSAYQSHSESWRGSITPGKVADLVLMNQRLSWAGLDENVSQSRPSAVFVGGNLVFGELP